MSDALTHRLAKIRENLRVGRFGNEEAVRQGAVLPVLAALSWPAFETAIVWPEFSLQGRRVDYALCHPSGKPRVLIEVKQPGQSTGADHQLFEYAFHHGVPVAVLTNGQEWHFFLPGELGSYGERRVYKLDIAERDLDESAQRLKRYLDYSSVCSGEALESARSDYRNVAREREIRAQLPEAWRTLVEDEDELLIELISDKVESLCGYKPDRGTVLSFLRESRSTPPSFTGAPDRLSLASVRSRRARTEVVGGPPDQRSIGFELDGQSCSASSGAQLYVRVMEVLSDRDLNFLERFAGLPRHGKSRRYLSRNRLELFPGRQDLVDECSQELKPGWWIGLNVSRGEVVKRIQLACDVAGLQFGRDLKMKLN